MVTICSPDAAQMADSRWLRRRDSRLDIEHDVVSPRQICAHPTPKSNSAFVFGVTNPVMVQGAVLAGITITEGWSEDPRKLLRTGDQVRVDPAQKVVELLRRAG